jgi:hypothetical protein
MFRVGGEGDQGHGPLGDGRTLAHWWFPAPAPTPSAPPAPPAKTPAEPAEYMSIATAARYADISPGMVRKLLADPLDPLPSFLLGRSRRISRASMDSYMARRMVRPVSVDALLVKLRSRRGRARRDTEALAQASSENRTAKKENL